MGDKAWSWVIVEEVKPQVRDTVEGLMATRVGIKPICADEKCIERIACYCCVELCPEGAMEVPDVEAFRRY